MFGEKLQVLRYVRNGAAAALRLTIIVALVGQQLAFSVASAQQVIVDPNGNVSFRPTVSNKGNTPVVNITKPNAGVSVNKYSGFSVDKNGVVLNNGTGVSSTSIAGNVAANPNLSGGAAHTIVNEVTSNVASTLAGPTEVAGQRADVIIANPNGITCQGCSFVNTDNVTLGSGTAVVNGAQVVLDVKSGTVTVGSDGLDGSAAGVKGVTLVGRAVIVDGKLTAIDTVTVSGGAQRFNVATKTATAQAGTGTAPAYVVDAAEFGAMRAGQIEILGNEAGLGVRTKGALDATAGTLTVKSGGNLDIRSARATGDVSLSAAKTATVERDVASLGKVTIKVGDYVSTERTGIFGQTGVYLTAEQSAKLLGRVQSDGDVSVLSPNLDLSGLVRTSKSLSITGEGDSNLTGLGLIADDVVLSFAGALSVENTVIAAQNTIGITAEDFRLGEDNKFTSVNVTDPIAVDISGTFTNAADLRDHANLALRFSKDFVNEETGVWAASSVALALDGSITNAGLIYGQNDLALSGTRLTNAGRILGDAVTLNFTSDVENTNVIAAVDGALVLNAAASVVNSGTLLGSTTSVAAADLENTLDGTIFAYDGLSITSAGSLINGGLLASQTTVQVAATTIIENSGTVFGATGLDAQAAAITSSGTLVSDGAITLSATDALIASGVIKSADLLTLRAGDFDLQVGSNVAANAIAFDGGNAVFGGTVSTIKTATIDAAALHIAGEFRTGDDLLITSESFATDETAQVLVGVNLADPLAAFSSTADLTLKTGALSLDGEIIIGGATDINATGAATMLGRLTGEGDLTLVTGDIAFAEAALLLSSGSIDLTADDVTTAATSLIAAGLGADGALIPNTHLAIHADEFALMGEIISAGETSLSAVGAGTLGGDMNTQGALTINTNSLLIMNAAQVLVGGNTAVTTGAFSVLDGATMINGIDLTNFDAPLGAGANVLVDATTIDFAGDVIAGGMIDLTATGPGAISGTLHAQGAIALATADLDMTETAELIAGADTVINASTLTLASGGTLINGTDLAIVADSIALLGDVTAGGNVFAGASGTIQIDGKLHNQGALVLTSDQLNFGATAEVLTGADTVITTGALTLASGGVLMNGVNLYDYAQALSSSADLDILATQITLAGDIFTGGTSTLKAQDGIDITGRLRSNDAMLLQTSTLDIASGALAVSGADMSLATTNALTNNGQLGAAGLLTISAQSLTNNAMIEAGDFIGAVEGLFENNDALVVHGSAALDLGDFVNLGLIRAAENLTLYSRADIANREAVIKAGGNLALVATGSVINQSALIEADASLSIDAASVTNEYRSSTYENSVGTDGSYSQTKSEVASVDFVLNDPDATGKGGYYYTTYANVTTTGPLAEAPFDYAKLPSNQTIFYPYTPGLDEAGLADTGTHFDGRAGSVTFNWFNGSIFTPTSPSAFIISGGDLSIEAASVSNNASSLTAQGNILINADTVENTGYENQRAGYSQSLSYNPGTPGNGDTDFGPFGKGYSPPVITVSNATLVSSQSLDPVLAQLNAGGDLTINAVTSFDNSGTAEANSIAVQAATITTGIEEDGFGAAGLDPVSLPATGGAASTTITSALSQTFADLNGTALNPTIAVGPGGAVDLTDFLELAALTAPQTDTSFDANLPGQTSVTDLLGSLKEETDLAPATEIYAPPGSPLEAILPSKPASGATPLYNPTVEAEAIRLAALQATGQALLFDDFATAEEQYRYLRENAAEFKSNSPDAVEGVPLTQAQIDNLNGPIVWYETKVVDGKRVLVPTLYLADSERTRAPPGSLTAQSNLALIGGDVTIAAADLSGVDITIGATGNVQIQNRNIQLSSIGKTDIVPEGETPQALKQGTRTNEVLQSNLTASGDLRILAGADLNLAATTLTSGGNLTLYSGGETSLTEAAQTFENAQSSGKTRTTTGTTKSISNTLTAGGDLVVTAGTNLISYGTDITAGRDATLVANHNLVLAAVQDIDSATYSYKKGGFLSSKVVRTTSYDLTNRGTTIVAAGDISATAGLGNLTTVGSRFDADGSVLLEASAGEIFAGAYTDASIRTSYKKTAFLGGLIGNTKEESSKITHQSATESLAAVDLTLVSGTDTTLIGTQLEAGQNLRIQTGGNLTALGALTSTEKSFFENSAGLIVTKTTTEKSFVETAQLASFSAGGALDFAVGAEAILAVYNTIAPTRPGNPLDRLDWDVETQLAALSAVDTPPDGLADLYPEELLALGGVQLMERDLANEYYFKETVALSPAFKALLAIALSYTGIGSTIVSTLFPNLAATAAMTGATASVSASAIATAQAVTTGLTAFTNNFILNSIDGVVSGDFDLGKILEGAVFSGVTAGLTAAINLDTFNIELGEAAKTSLLGFGSKFTVENILNGALDGMISSGLSSLAYGTDFGEGFKTAIISTVANLAMADIQYAIGEIGVIRDADGNITKTDKNWEGSAGHILLHGIVGCAAAAAQNASCAAGAAGGIAQGLYAGTIPGSGPISDEQQQKNAEFLGAVAGFFLSGGQAQNVTAAASIARSGLTNNRQLHREEAEAIRENAKKFAEQMGITEEEAIALLTAEALRGVSDDFSHLPKGEKARAFLNEMKKNLGKVQDQTLFGELDHSSKEYKNSVLNAGQIYAARDLYGMVDTPTTWNGVDYALVKANASLFHEFKQAGRTDTLDLLWGTHDRAADLFALASWKESGLALNASAAKIDRTYDDVSDLWAAGSALATSGGIAATRSRGVFSFGEISGLNTSDPRTEIVSNAFWLDLATMTSGATGGALLSKSKALSRGKRNLATQTDKDAPKGGAGLCSFHGGTLVLTDTGLLPIRDLRPQMSVWSRDADSGAMDWKRVEAQYSNPYEETVSVTIRDLEGGAEQTIVSNRIHPYFVQTTREVMNSSEGHVYAGPLENGHWIDAGNLISGDRLLNVDGSWAEVIGVEIEAKPLTAFNLTVADFHTYFVAANENAAPVWVHNNCWDDLPNGSKVTGSTNQFGQQTYKGPNGENLYKGHDGRFYDALKYPPVSKNQWFSDAAKNLGFTKTNYKSHGQPVYKKGNQYITPDVDSHNGGAWKMAGSVKDLGSKKTRTGTFDINLNKIGD